MTNTKNRLNLDAFIELLNKDRFKTIECVLSGRIGNIMLEMFSFFYFIKKHHLYDYKPVISSKYDFIDMNDILRCKDYLSSIMPVLNNVRTVFANESQYCKAMKKKHDAKAYGKWLGLSFNAQLVGTALDDKISRLCLNDFDYIETHFFESAYNNVGFYQKNADAATLFSALFYDKQLFDHVDVTSDNDVAYCVRLGDFKTLMPNCLYDVQTLKNDILYINRAHKNKRILVFSDDIAECKTMLNDLHFLSYHTNISDYEDLIAASKCHAVYGNKYSTFVQVSQILNFLQK